MLPSKGYFRSIDCPFYKNNLCHRFYCHFRHNKKESFISSRLELTDFINNEDNSEIFQNVHETMKNGSHEDRDKNSLEIVHSTINDENVASRVNVETTNEKKAYQSLTDIPKYNPTPISELKTLYKQTSKTDDHLDKASKLKFNQNTKIETLKDSNIIETLVDYLMKSDSINEGVENKVEISVDSDVKNNIIKKPSDSQFSAADSTTVQKGVEEIFPTQNHDSIVQENIKLKEMINQLTVIENCNGPNNEKQVLDNVTLLEDLMGTGINSIDKKDLEKVKITKIDNINTEDNGKTFMKYKLKNNDRVISKQYKRHMHSIKNANFTSGSKNQRCIFDNKKSNHTKNDSKKKVKNVCKSVDKSDTKDKTQNVTCDTEVILISDSEDVSELAVSDKSTTGDINEKFEDSLPEPKRKVRVSHVLSQNSGPHQTGNSCQEKTYAKFKTNSIENDYQLSKQKGRLAHTLNYKTLSVQTVQDHLSHWESVKERVKNKCTNPSGEAGYQNWSRVKISPVPNVASLMNSKKMLYSRIHQWKSKTSI